MVHDTLRRYRPRQSPRRTSPSRVRLACGVIDVVKADLGVRRREIGTASARSLLLTLLGEFVLPRGTPVWSGALVAALSDIGVEEKSARQALSRTAAEGLLFSEREGRRVRWQLSAAGLELLQDGTERIYGFGRRVEQWDGHWLVVTVSVPETQRQLRHQLRTRLTWSGLGSPLPGVWVTPDTSKAEQIANAISELGVEGFSFTGPFGPVGEQQRLVQTAWSLADVQSRYQQFLVDFAEDPVTSPREAFQAQIALVQQWRRFPFMDPALPAALLPEAWPGPVAAELFHQRRAGWHQAAQGYWEQLCSSAAART